MKTIAILSNYNNARPLDSIIKYIRDEALTSGYKSIIHIGQGFRGLLTGKILDITYINLVSF